MFGLSSSFVPIRVLPQTRARHLSRPINTQTRAYVTWVMDGLGCDTARSGDDGSLLKTRRDLSCPTKPMEISKLCLDSDGLFRIGDAAFEAKGEDIWLTNVNAGGGEESFKDDSTVKLNGKPVSYDQSVKLTPGAVLEIAGKTWQLNRNTIAHA